MTATVHKFSCAHQKSHDDINVTANCHRGKGHKLPHRGPEVATGRLVTWYDVDQHDMPGTWAFSSAATEQLGAYRDGKAEVWTDDDGWTYAGGVRHPDPIDGAWDAVARVTPWLAYGAATMAAWTFPALVVIVWRAALR